MVKRVNRKSTKNGNNSSVTPPSFNKLVKQAIQQEKQLKWNYDDSGIQTVSTSAIYHSPSLLVTQGLTANQRVGSSINLKDMHVRCSFVIGDVTQLMRLVVFKWVVSNTSDVPSTGEIFDATGGLTVFAPFLKYNPSRFRILYDNMFTLDTYHPTKVLEFSLKLNFKSEYDIGVNTGKGHLYYMIVSDSGGIPHPSYSITEQITWLDSE